MSGALKTVGTIAGIASSVLAFVPGMQPIAAGLMAASAVLSIGGGLLQKKPAVLGSTTDITIGSNNPTPYVMGRTYVGGTMVHDVGYGPTIKGVPNPYRSMVFVDSVGPIEEYEAFQVEFANVAFSGANATGYYANYLYRSSQLGACPEASALTGPFGYPANWSAAHKLSGLAARMVTLKDDREGKIYSSGVPRFGAILKGPKVYDPRQDGTYPGGVGAVRALNEATYVGGAAAQNPSCHAVTYALGRWQNGKKVMGVGLAVDAIDWPAWVEFSNTCDANEWKIGGTIHEPGSRWDNLKRICAAGGAMPAWVGGKLTVLFPRPRVALDTIDADDLADGEGSILDIRSWKDRQNVLVPKVPLETHKWEMVQLDPVRNEAFIAADGEEKKEEFPIELVPYKDQAVELTGYELWNRRETGPIVLNCKVRMIEYKVGDALAPGATLIEEVDPEGLLGLAGKAWVIIGRRLDPATATVELTFETDTSAKHAAVLGTIGAPPPVPSFLTGEELDGVAGTLLEREAAVLIANSYTSPTRVLSASELGGAGSIAVLAHQRVYPDGVIVEIAAQTIGGLLTDKPYFLYYDDPARADPAPAILATPDPSLAQLGTGRHALGRVRTPINGSDVVNEGGGVMPTGSMLGGELVTAEP